MTGHDHQANLGESGHAFPASTAEPTPYDDRSGENPYAQREPDRHQPPTNAEPGHINWPIGDDDQSTAGTAAAGLGTAELGALRALRQSAEQAQPADATELPATTVHSTDAPRTGGIGAAELSALRALRQGAEQAPPADAAELPATTGHSSDATTSLVHGERAVASNFSVAANPEAGVNSDGGDPRERGHEAADDFRTGRMPFDDYFNAWKRQQEFQDELDIVDATQDPNGLLPPPQKNHL